MRISFLPFALAAMVLAGFSGHNDWTLIAASAVLVVLAMMLDRRRARFDELEARYRAEQETDFEPPIERVVEAPLLIGSHSTNDKAR